MLATIIRAGGVDLFSLTDALEAVDVDEGVVVDSSMGDSLIEPPAPTPSFVIGALNPTEQGVWGNVDGGTVSATLFTNLDVVLRIGMAAERGVPTLLIVPPPLVPPSGPPSLVIVPCRLEDVDTLYLHLWAFTSSLLDREKEQSPQPQERQRPDLRGLRSSLPTDLTPETGLQTYHIVTEVFRAAGVELAEDPSRGPDKGFDLALLSSRQSDDVVLVEVKAGYLTEDQLIGAEKHLRNTVVHRHAALGLMVYHDMRGRRYPQSEAQPMVVRMSLRDLIDRLRLEGFSEVLKSEVSRAVERM